MEPSPAIRAGMLAAVAYLRCEAFSPLKTEIVKAGATPKLPQSGSPQVLRLKSAKTEGYA